MRHFDSLSISRYSLMLVKFDFPHMSFEEAKEYLPQIDADGSWHLITRRDSKTLAKMVAASLESEQVHHNFQFIYRC